MSEPCVVGVDLGGTNVRAAVFRSDGTPVSDRISTPSLAQSGADAVVGAIEQTVRQAMDTSSERPLAVGIAVPGHIDSVGGIVRWAPNFGIEVDGVFRHWENVPLATSLESRLGLPIRLGNDANLAALAEYRFGSGRNSVPCLAMLTIGTGIGGGVVLGPGSVLGRADEPLLLVGGNQGGGELGHIALLHGGLDCNAGSYGALEGYCQRDSIVRRAVHRLRRGRESAILDLAGGDLARVEPKHLAQAADAGDELAIEVWTEVGTYLGVGIGSLVNVFAPSVFAIGGQIAKAGKWLLEPAIASARNVAIPSLFADCRIGPAEIADDAGMLGAAALAAAGGGIRG